MKKAIIIVSVLLGCLLTISAQNVKIGDSPGAADPSAILELESGNKGFLTTHVTLTSTTDQTTIASPATGLLVFNTATTNTGTNDVSPGFYYWTGSAWEAIDDTPPPTYPAGSVFCASGPTAIVDVTSPTGKTWMDRNLGATQAATSSTDADSYGDLFQWGRLSDGHQCRTSGTTITLSSSDQPGDGNFILTPNSQSDWRSPENTNLWGVSGINNPCPSGYRPPTDTELDAERASWASNNAAGALASPLKLPMAGYRNSSNGSLNNVGTVGYCWSSTVSSTDSRLMCFYSTDALVITVSRAHGNAVRCLKD